MAPASSSKKDSGLYKEREILFAKINIQGNNATFADVRFGTLAA